MISGIIETTAAATGYFNSYVPRIVPKGKIERGELEKISEEVRRVSPVQKVYNSKGRAVDYHEQGQNVRFFA